MKQTSYKWYPVPAGREKIHIGKFKAGPVDVIPGCEQDETHAIPQGVLFRGKRYNNFSVTPFGTLCLGDSPIFFQELSREKLLPETDAPLIIPLGELLQSVA